MYIIICFGKLLFTVCVCLNTDSEHPPNANPGYTPGMVMGLYIATFCKKVYARCSLRLIFPSGSVALFKIVGYLAYTTVKQLYHLLLYQCFENSSLLQATFLSLLHGYVCIHIPTSVHERLLLETGTTVV